MIVEPKLAAAVGAIGAEVAYWSDFGGRRVTVDARILTERATAPARADSSRVSRNGSCRLVEVRDGWIAVSLPRPEDIALIPAMVGEEGDGCPWERLATALSTETAASVLERAELLGLAVGALGEAAGGANTDSGRARRGRTWRARPRVIDLSALWAGPLCGALLAEAGCDVIRIESLGRRDRTAETQPALSKRLNGAKRVIALDLSTASGQEALGALIARADILITSARPRGLATIGLAPTGASGAIHIAITAHGFTGPGAMRIGFGDDCAVAGGLVDLDANGSPAFVGDAIADPLTGARAAAVALRALALASAGLYDISLAGTAAQVARMRRGDA